MAKNGERKASCSERGVTLIEMLVVVLILGLFAGLVGVKVLGHVDPARATAARAQFHGFQLALDSYKLDVGRYPTTEQGLQALRVAPDAVANWKGPYLRIEIPLDPWKRAYLYKFPSEHGDEPDLISLGADGQPGGEGNDADIVSWKSN